MSFSVDHVNINEPDQAEFSINILSPALVEQQKFIYSLDKWRAWVLINVETDIIYKKDLEQIQKL